MSCFETPSVMYVGSDSGGSGLSTFILPNNWDSGRRLFGKTGMSGREATGREAHTTLFLTLLSVQAGTIISYFLHNRFDCVVFRRMSHTNSQGIN